VEGVNFKGSPTRIAETFYFCLEKFVSAPSFGFPTDGLANMGFPALESPFSSLFKIIKGAHPIFALTLDTKEGNSSLHFGGYSASFAPYILWSEAQTNLKPIEYFFPMYHFTLCGPANPSFSILLGTSFWMSRVDTVTPYLHLPHPLFQLILAYIPYHCRSNYTQRSGHLVCRVNRNSVHRQSRHLSHAHSSRIAYQSRTEFHSDPKSTTSLPPFPPLTFRLQDILIDTQPFTSLAIPLEGMVTGIIEETDGTLTVTFGICDLDYSRDTLVSYYSQSEIVVFGTLPLRPFYVVFNSESKRTGFSQRDPTVSTDTSFCLPKPSCIGPYLYDPLTNACTRPPCSDYYFQTFDETKGECVLKTAAHIPLVIVFLVFVVLEVILFEAYDVSMFKMREKIPIFR
jgi:hypothetical protein